MFSLLIWNYENTLFVWEIDTLSREVTKLILSPSEKGTTLKGKNFAPFGNKFFPFRVELFSEGVEC